MPEGALVAAGGGRRHWVVWASLLRQGHERASAGLMGGSGQGAGLFSPSAVLSRAVEGQWEPSTLLPVALCSSPPDSGGSLC